MKVLKAGLFSLVFAVSGLTLHAEFSDSSEKAENVSSITAAKIVLPPNFAAAVIAEKLPSPRHIAVAPNGDVYVKLNRLQDGKGIIRLRDKNKDGVIDEQFAFGNYAGTGIYIKNGYLYASSNQEVYRYRLTANRELASTDNPEVLVTGLVARGRDESKSIVADNKGNLYVTVGSYSNGCALEAGGKGQNPCKLLDSIGGVWQFSAAKMKQQYKDGKRYGTGLKNVVGLDWNTAANALFVMQHGRDALDEYPAFTKKQSAELPAETMYRIHPGADAGWPYIYYDHVKKQKMVAPEYGGDGVKTGGAKAINPAVAFPAHLAPNGLLFYTGNQFPEKYRNGAFIAFHGFSPELKKGFLVAFVPFKNGKPSGKWEIFADNFGEDEGQPATAGVHRPCGLAQGTDGSLYVTDDIRGSVYRISYKK